MCAIKRPIEGIHGHTVCVDKGVQFRRVAVSRLMGNDCWRQKGARTMQFRDRTEAGRLLADKLTAYVDCPDLLVLALPRGGVPVAFEVARALHAPLDIVLVRKLGVPGHKELAMGAIASGGVHVLDVDIVRSVRD
jgi:hypothetical protein